MAASVEHDRHAHVLALYGHGFSGSSSRGRPTLIMELCDGSVSDALSHDVRNFKILSFVSPRGYLIV
jgi:hypothetical protein